MPFSHYSKARTMLRRLSSELSGRRNVEDFEGVESIARRMRIILPTSVRERALSVLCVLVE